MSTIQCPGCGQTYKARDDLAGKKVKCKCGQAFAMPAAAIPDLAPESPQPSLLDDEVPARSGQSPLDGPLGGEIAGGTTLPRSTPVGRPASGKGGSNLLVVGLIVGGSAVGVLLIGILIFSLTGGNEPASTPEAPAQPTAEAGQLDETAGLPGFATPEEAFEAFKKTSADKDWEAQMKTMTPESQEMIVGITVSAAKMLAMMDPGIAEVLKKHGIEPSAQNMPTGQPQDLEALSQGIMGTEEQRREYAAAVKDKPAFFGEIKPKLDAVAKGMQMPGMDISEMQAEAERAQAEAKLNDVVINGDSARGMMSTVFRGQPQSAPMGFKKIDGRWYIHQASPQGGTVF